MRNCNSFIMFEVYTFVSVINLLEYSYVLIKLINCSQLFGAVLFRNSCEKSIFRER